MAFSHVGMFHVSVRSICQEIDIGGHDGIETLVELKTETETGCPESDSIPTPRAAGGT